MKQYIKYVLIILIGPLIGIYMSTVFLFPMGITWLGDTTYPLELAGQHYQEYGLSVYIAILIFGLPVHFLLRKYKKVSFWVYFSIGTVIGLLATPVLYAGKDLFREPIPFFESLAWVLTFRLFLPMFSTLIAYIVFWSFIVYLPRKKKVPT